MYKLASKITADSPDFQERKSAYTALLKKYRKFLEEYSYARPDKALKNHTAKGKLLARDRIDLLIDANTPFLELSTFAAYGQYDNQFPSAGIITGIGVIKGKEAVIVANDATVKGGTYVAETIKKHLRAQEIAMENNLPCVYLVDSGGIFLPEQANVFPDKEDFGRIFYNQARMSAENIPQIAVVMGSSTAGGAYVPAMCDETIMVRNQATIFLGGPPLVKAATGEDVTAEELGGAAVHTSVSGVADHIAENDEHALQICRNIFENIPSEKEQHLEQAEIVEPAYNPSELYGIIPFSARELIDPREIIARVVDGSLFHEFKKDYGTTLVTGFARVMGYPVGIVANHGIMFSESALKGAHFIELCNHREIPLLFLQNITGFMVGKQYEHGGIAKNGAKMVHAVANANVPKFTIITGGSYGAGNYAMAGRAYGPRLLFMWPGSTISVMGAEQAANVLTTVKTNQLKKQGKSMHEGDIEKIRNEILHKYGKESSAYYSSSRLWDDGIIDPVDTRKIIAMGISISLNKKYDQPKTGVYRM